MITVSTYIFNFIIFLWAPSLVQMQYSYIPLPPSNMIRIPFGNLDDTNGGIQPEFLGTAMRTHDSEMQQDVFQPFPKAPSQGSYPTVPQSAQLGGRQENERTAARRVSQNPPQYSAPERQSLIAQSYLPTFENQQRQRSMNSYQAQSAPQETQQRQTMSVQQRYPDGNHYNSHFSLEQGHPESMVEPQQEKAIEQSQANSARTIQRGPLDSQQSVTFGQAQWNQPKGTQYVSRFGEQQLRFSGTGFSSNIHEEPLRTPQYGQPFSGVQNSTFREPEGLGYGMEQGPTFGGQKESQYRVHPGPSFSIQQSSQSSGLIGAEQNPFGVQLRSALQGGQQRSLFSWKLGPQPGVYMDHPFGEQQSSQSNVQQDFVFGRQQEPTYGAQQAPLLKFQDVSQPRVPPFNEQSSPFGGQSFPQYGEQPTLGLEGGSRPKELPSFNGLQGPPFGGLQPPQYRGPQIPSLEFQDGSRPQVHPFNEQASFGVQRVTQYTEQKFPSFGFQGGSRAQELPSFGGPQGPTFEGQQPPQYRGQHMASLQFQDGSRQQVPQFNEQDSFSGQYTEQQLPSFGFQDGSRAQESPSFDGRQGPLFEGQQPTQFRGKHMPLLEFQDASRLHAPLFNEQATFGRQRVPQYREEQVPSLFRFQGGSHTEESSLFGMTHGPHFGQPRDSFQDDSRVQEATSFDGQQRLPLGGQRVPQNGQQQTASFGFQSGSSAQESIPFGITQGPQFGQPRVMIQGGLRAQQAPAFEGQLEPSFGGQQVPRNGEQLTPSSVFQGVSRAQENAQMEVKPGSQFGQPRDVYDGIQPMVPDQQQTGLQQTSYDEPYVVKHFGPMLGVIHKISSWGGPEMEYGDQPKSTTGTQYGGRFAPSLEQSFGVQMENWMGQPQNAQPRRDEQGSQNGQRGLSSKKIPLPSDPPPTFQLKPTPDFSQGTNRGSSQTFQQDFTVAARQTQPEISLTGIGKVPQKSSLWSYRSLLQRLPQLQPFGKASVLIQPIEMHSATLEEGHSMELSKRTDFGQEPRQDDKLVSTSGRSANLNQDQMVLTQRAREGQIMVPFQISEQPRQSFGERESMIPVMVPTPKMHAKSVEQQLNEEQRQPFVWSPDSQQEAQSILPMDQSSKLEQGQLMRPQMSEFNLLQSVDDQQARTSMPVIQHAELQQRQPMGPPVELKQEQLKQELLQQERFQHDQQGPRVDQQELSEGPQIEVSAGQRKQTVEETSGARALTQHTKSQFQIRAPKREKKLTTGGHATSTTT